MREPGPSHIPPRPRLPGSDEGGIAPLTLAAALLADDHTLFREGMAFLLRDIAPQARIWQADGLDAALECLASHPEIELFLIDLAMPGMVGPWSIRAVRDAYPNVRVVVLSGSEGVDTVKLSIDAGAAGYIPKSAEKEVMAAALHQIMHGELYVPPAAVAALPGSGAGSGPPVGTLPVSPLPASGGAELGPDMDGTGGAPGALPTIGRLTPRQREVLKCLAQGKSNKEIARELNLAEGTVKIHMEAILKGLHARNRTQAVVIASRMKLA